MGGRLKRTLDFCAEVGLETVATPHARCKTEAEYHQFGRDMSAAAEAEAQPDSLLPLMDSRKFLSRLV